MTKRFLIWVVSCFAASLFAEVKLNPLFTDHMVLQRNHATPVYGTADPGENITVEFAGQVKTAVAGENGEWKVTLDPMPASSKPRSLSVQSTIGHHKSSIVDVLVGDVWLCAGQSNMATEIRLYPTLREAKADVLNNSQVRMFKFQREGIGAEKPSKEVVIDAPFQNSWQKMTPAMAREFSATGAFFGNALQPMAGIPIGLLYANRGGTAVNQWLPMEFMQSKPELYAPFLGADNPWWTDGPRNPGLIRAPSRLFNGTIHPVIPFAIRGCIWYQGESDDRYSDIYGEMFSDLITVWRNLWGYDFQFLFVQLAPYDVVGWDARREAWAFLREAQDAALALPNTARAVIIDSGEQLDIHPQNKQPVGERLALLAANLDQPDIEAHSPEFDTAEVVGSKIRVTFKYAASGLEARRVAMNKNKRIEPGTDPEAFVIEADTLAGFTVCGEDHKFVPAKARITGTNTVEVWADSVDAPVAVRYGWANFPLCNLYNSAGLPACPFRSDHFPPPDFSESGLDVSAAQIQQVQKEVRDDFSGELPNVWENLHTAGWQAVDGHVQAGAFSGSHYVLANNDATADEDMKIDVSVSISSAGRNAWGGLAFNVQNANSFYVLRIKFDTGAYQLLRMVDGGKPLVVDSANASRKFEVGGVYSLRLQSVPKQGFYAVTIRDAGNDDVMLARVKVEAAPVFVSARAGLYCGSKTAQPDLFVFDDFVFKAGK
ncbi:sialate O-acetylesterase [Tichowtungia aerotolerans]|uniref:Sialate O-acetylesterase domain-containing protein n=1 Tax=Tichowtungia aerotolerans TaxID=2697043 RepID=A0A6P1M362_9BACT|nr:sialate O-acetylesterase [Tichowtungia aerotolerans]QHI68277.1 hypothetical protein GT409_02005 [Tichowtungia aerotolerans]